MAFRSFDVDDNYAIYLNAFAEFLVECGINSMSVSPDSFFDVKQRVAEAGQRSARAN